ncbi:ECF transporter S component [Mycoplasmopsis cynos]|uniref:ECF transporter S component n=1 Tax=Mycoplasmopsis cynos TaxID=171284 RepID=UPI002AFDDC03|nr:ECF transporter S component [Mycoplasmopsis cynos]WQQ17904.1 ECF transporter S component [Mycoplasmopsis cynos]
MNLNNMYIENKKSINLAFMNFFLKCTSIALFIVLLLNQINVINLFNVTRIFEKTVLSIVLWQFYALLFFATTFFIIKEREYWKKIFHYLVIENPKAFKRILIIYSLYLPIVDFYRIAFINSLFIENDLIISNWKVGLIKNNIRFSIYDISLAGVLMCIFLIIAAVKNFTPLKIVGLDPEFIFYIIFAFFFGKFKGAFLSFVADFFNLLLDGKIGFYHEAYAIVPIVMTILIGVFIDMFRKYKRIWVVLMEFFLVLVFCALIYVFILNMNDPKGIKISKTFGFSRVSLGVFIALLVITLSIFAIFNVFVIKYLTAKNKASKQRYSYLLLSIFLVVFVIVLARWIWGPFAFIQYANRYLGRGYDLSNRYLIVMVPIILRSVIALPIYIIVVNALIPILAFLKKTILKNEYDLTYY